MLLVYSGSPPVSAEFGKHLPTAPSSTHGSGSHGFGGDEPGTGGVQYADVPSLLIDGRNPVIITAIPRV